MHNILNYCRLVYINKLYKIICIWLYIITDYTNTIDVYSWIHGHQFYGYINKIQMYNNTFLFVLHFFIQ